MKLSIAMATYNGAAFLPQQLRSFIDQSRRPDELVVTDDGSTDATIEILEAFRASAPFNVVLHRNPSTLRVARNFERAISLCTGDLIFLSDQDDVWYPAKLARVAAEFEAHPSAWVVINDQIITDAELRHSGRTKLTNIESMGLGRSGFFTGCCTTIRREWTDYAFPLPEGLTHDRWINMLAEHLAVRRVITEPLQFYRRHGDNVSTWAASNPRGVNMVSTVLTHGLRDARDGWQAMIADNRVFIEHLQTRADRAIEIAGEQAHSQALADLRRSITSIELRIQMASLPFWRRAPAALRLLHQGHYRQFSGWKSAAKDIVRSPTRRG